MLRNLSQKELLKVSRAIVQPLLPNFHKGQAGKIAVIGGCEDYTGAPYFSASSSALLGADLSHIVCEKVAAPVIKLYSPDLMVHPYLYDLGNAELRQHLSQSDLDALSKLTLDQVFEKQTKIDEFIDKVVLPKVSLLLNRIELVVIGPGFGRDPLMLKSLVRIIEEVKVLNKPIIMDADALFLLSIKPRIIKGYSQAYITPNVVELDRIAKALEIESSIGEKNIDKLVQTSIQLSQKLGNVTVILKNFKDVIARNDQYVVIDIEGSPRRVGGQGDTLTGALATFVNWSNNYNKELFTSPLDKKLTPDELNLLACAAASATVRTASAKAFKKYGRAMQTSSMHKCLGEAYTDLFENEKFLNRF